MYRFLIYSTLFTYKLAMLIKQKILVLYPVCICTYIVTIFMTCNAYQNNIHTFALFSLSCLFGQQGHCHPLIRKNFLNVHH